MRGCTDRAIEDIVASQLVCPLSRAVPPAEVPYKPPCVVSPTVPAYLLEVSAPVRLEPAVLQCRRAAFEAIRHVDGVLKGFGFSASPGGKDAVVTLTVVTKSGTQRVRVVRRYRKPGGKEEKQ